jgi:hypothetical protein
VSFFVDLEELLFNPANRKASVILFNVSVLAYLDDGTFQVILPTDFAWVEIARVHEQISGYATDVSEEPKAAVAVPRAYLQCRAFREIDAARA